MLLAAAISATAVVPGTCKGISDHKNVQTAWEEGYSYKRVSVWSSCVCLDICASCDVCLANGMCRYSCADEPSVQF